MNLLQPDLEMIEALQWRCQKPDNLPVEMTVFEWYNEFQQVLS